MAAAELRLEPMTEEPALPTPAAEVPTLDASMLEGQMLEGFDLTDVEVAVGSAAQESAEAVAERNFASALEDFAAHVPAHQHSAPSAAEFVSELDALFGDARTGRGEKSPAAEVASAMEDSSSLTLEPQDAEPGAFPAIFDQFDAAKASIPDAVDGSFRPAPLPSRDAEPATPALAEPSLPPDWSLEPLDENTVVTPPQGKASAFGIETMSATEFMMPEDDTPVTAPPITEGLSLELMPMEDAVAPEEFVAVVPSSAGMRLESDRGAGKLKVGSGAQLSRVVVLGASIGGPEAVRDFLGRMPRNFPALFVLAQHGR
jgi:hypothetical protein